MFITYREYHIAMMMSTNFSPIVLFLMRTQYSFAYCPFSIRIFFLALFPVMSHILTGCELIYHSTVWYCSVNCRWVYFSARTSAVGDISWLRSYAYDNNNVSS